MDVDNQIKDIKMSRHLGGIDPTFQTTFCPHCAQPIYLDARRPNEGDWDGLEFDEYCVRCLNAILENKRGGNE